MLSLWLHTFDVLGAALPVLEIKKMISLTSHCLIIPVLLLGSGLTCYQVLDTTLLRSWYLISLVNYPLPLRSIHYIDASDHACLLIAMHILNLGHLHKTSPNCPPPHRDSSFTF